MSDTFLPPGVSPDLIREAAEEYRAAHLRIPPPDFSSWPRWRRDQWFSEGAASYAASQSAAPDDTPRRLRVASPSEPFTTSQFTPAYQTGLVALTGEELLTREFPAREMLLAPFLPSKGLAMLFAGRGIGKTWLGLNIAHAVAGGGSFLRWQASRPCRVCYIDGEMPAGVLKDRYAAVVAGAPFEAPESHFRLVAADLQPDGLPDLADPIAQRFYDGVIADAELIIVDNLSTVCRSLRENEADSWGPVQSWCLRQRAAGKSVLLIHHAGKGGGQRGTSKKEDVLDAVIALRRPIDYSASQGARFEVHFSKARGFWGEEAEPFEACLADGKWIMSEIVSDGGVEAIRALKGGGATIREIADRLGMSKSAVERRLKGACE